MTFAGFWVDGAVRKPEKRHLDSTNYITINWKDKNPDFDICSEWFEEWNEVYWLDTTPRELLTPEELFSVLRVAWPHLQCIKKEYDNWCVLGHGYSTHTPVDWGDLTQYPPPVETQWVQVTKENLSKYILQPCRMRKGDLTYSGIVAGWHLEDDQCLVSSTYDEDDSMLQWDCVEVQE